MTVAIKTEIAGIREAVASLNKIEPGLRKQFAAELNQIAAPALNVAKSRYADLGVPLSGMGKVWQQGSRQLFPYSATKAQSGVKVTLDTRRNALAVIVISQKNQTASIYETAGRKNPSQLSTNLGRTPRPGRTRLFGPAVYSKIREINKEIEQAALRVFNKVNRELR